MRPSYVIRCGFAALRSFLIQFLKRRPRNRAATVFLISTLEIPPRPSELRADSLGRPAKLLDEFRDGRTITVLSSEDRRGVRREFCEHSPDDFNRLHLFQPRGRLSIGRGFLNGDSCRGDVFSLDPSPMKSYLPVSDPRQPGPGRSSSRVELVECSGCGEERLLYRVTHRVRIGPDDARDVPPHTHAVLVVQSGPVRVA